MILFVRQAVSEHANVAGKMNSPQFGLMDKSIWASGLIPVVDITSLYSFHISAVAARKTPAYLATDTKG